MEQTTPEENIQLEIELKKDVPPDAPDWWTKVRSPLTFEPYTAPDKTIYIGNSGISLTFSTRREDLNKGVADLDFMVSGTYRSKDKSLSVPKIGESFALLLGAITKIISTPSIEVHYLKGVTTETLFKRLHRFLNRYYFDILTVKADKDVPKGSKAYVVVISNLKTYMREVKPPQETPVWLTVLSAAIPKAVSSLFTPKPNIMEDPLILKFMKRLEQLKYPENTVLNPRIFISQFEDGTVSTDVFR